MRNFCYIQQIEKLLPIENADKIEIAKIKGWSTVEGFVFKSIGLDIMENRVTFKVINNDYLLNSNPVVCVSGSKKN